MKKNVKIIVSALLALLLLTTCLPALPVFADTDTVVNVIGKTATVRKQSTVYLGEVVVNGVSMMKYVYSDDLSHSESVYAVLRDGLSEFEDGAYAALIPEILGQTEEVGLAACTNKNFTSSMDEVWKSAENAGKSIYTTKDVLSSSSEDLYETNADFAAKCDGALTDPDSYLYGADIVDPTGDQYAVCGVLGRLSTSITDTVTYTVIDGKLVKLIDRDYDYDCESTTVICTKVELLSNRIETVSSEERLSKASTVYLGDVSIDGTVSVKYVYSGDLTASGTVALAVKDCLSGMEDGDFAALFDGFDYYSASTGLVLCTDPDKTAVMDENWADARYVGDLYSPGATVLYENGGALYDLDAGFGTTTDEHNGEVQSYIDTILDADKRVIVHTDVSSFDDVYYTIYEGQIVKHVETTVVYSCEAVTVVYTKVRLTADAALGDVNGDSFKNVTDVTAILNILAGGAAPEHLPIADIDKDGAITVSDATILLNVLAYV